MEKKHNGKVTLKCVLYSKVLKDEAMKVTEIYGTGTGTEYMVSCVAGPENTLFFSNVVFP